MMGATESHHRSTDPRRWTQKPRDVHEHSPEGFGFTREGYTRAFGL